MSPEAKKSTFKEMIAKGSLKLRIMSEMTEGPNASQKWKESIYKKHEEEMIERLKKGTEIISE
jgi:hypothetical protein